MPEHPGTGAAHLKKGELVLLDYDLWAEGGGKSDLIDTTHAEVAKSSDYTLPAGMEFGPRPHLVGGDEFPPALEAAVEAAGVGHEVEKEFAPAEAFGERDPKLIELFSMHEIERLPEMRREDAELRLGSVLTIHGRRGRVVTFTAARVRVDFNPPFAGKKIRAKFKVESAVTEAPARARALIELTYGHGPEFTVALHDKVLTITVPDRAKFDLAWHAAAKSRLVERLREQLKPKSIHFLEEYATPTAKEAKEAEAAKPAPAAAAAPSAAADASPTSPKSGAKHDAAAPAHPEATPS